MSENENGSAPGSVLRMLRSERGLTVRELAKMVDLPYSTLSKLENDKMALTYEKMCKIAQGLQVDIGRLVASDTAGRIHAPSTGRRSIARGLASAPPTPKDPPHQYLADELLNKDMQPIITDVLPRSVAELGGLIKHAGEEFLYVIAGSMELHSDLYAPLRLDAGDSVYFDSGMAHGYIRVSEEPCRVLSVCTGQTMEQLALVVRQGDSRADTAT